MSDKADDYVASIVGAGILNGILDTVADVKVVPIYDSDGEPVPELLVKYPKLGPYDSWYRVTIKLDRFGDEGPS